MIQQKVVYVTSYSQYILKHKILLQAGKFNIFGQGEGEVYVLINIASFLCNACNEKKTLLYLPCSFANLWIFMNNYEISIFSENITSK